MRGFKKEMVVSSSGSCRVAGKDRGWDVVARASGDFGEQLQRRMLMGKR